MKYKFFYVICLFNIAINAGIESNDNNNSSYAMLKNVVCWPWSVVKKCVKYIEKKGACDQAQQDLEWFKNNQANLINNSDVSNISKAAQELVEAGKEHNTIVSAISENIKKIADHGEDIKNGIAWVGIGYSAYKGYRFLFPTALEKAKHEAEVSKVACDLARYKAIAAFGKCYMEHKHEAKDEEGIPNACVELDRQCAALRRNKW